MSDSGVATLIANAANIRRLSLRGCVQMSDAGLKGLGGCRTLEYLGVSNCPYVTLAGINLSACVNISELNAASTSVGDEAVVQQAWDWGQLSQLRFVNLCAV